MSLFGARRPARGQLFVGERRVRLRSPADALKHGIAVAFVPEDRKTEGLMLPMSVRDNLTLAILGRVSRLGVIRRRLERPLVESVIARLQIKTRDASLQEVGTPLGRESAEGVLIGPLATDRTRCAAAVRHHARRGCRNQARHLRAQS